MKSEYKISPLIAAGALLCAGIVFFAPDAKAAPAPSTPTYHTLALPRRGNPMKILADTVGKDHVPVVLSLNRLDAEHLRAGSSLIIPDTFTDFMSYSPFPTTLPGAASTPRLVLISQHMQAFGAYDHGMLVRWGPTSTGKRLTPTPNKLYFINWKGKKVISSIDDSWILPWYENLDNFAGISMHQYELPGYPASHSCVRLTQDDAYWLYTWTDAWKVTRDGGAVARYGTPVIVFGSYAYGKPAPWKALAAHADATTLSPDELASVFASYAETIAVRTAK